MKVIDFKSINHKVSFKNFKDLKQYELPEFCFTGRSNVGKSSLINAITRRKTIATTSSRPGHTKKIFLFFIDKKFILVDLPGYGYTQTSKKKTEQMSNLLYLYLTKRTKLKKIFLLIDSRHGFKNIDINFLEFLDAHQVPFQIVLTKVDKINDKHRKELLKKFNLHKLIYESDPLFTSSKKKIGIKEIRTKILSSCN